jgi:outer membrane cobalamin receptor
MKKVVWLWVFLVMMAGMVCWSLTAEGADVELGRVVVTATKTETEISEVPQSTTVITKDEIQKTPDRTLGEIIQRAVGTEVTQYGPRGAVSLPKIRGAEAEQVLILINGRRVNDAQSAKFDLSNLPLNKDDIERIEVLRGAASALYGADAMGGVINIITKAPSKKPEAQASASYGRFHTQSYSLTHRWKPGAFGYGLSIGKERSSGYRPNSDYDGWTLGGELSYDLPSQSLLNFSARTLQKEIGLPGSETYPDPDDRQKDDVTQLDLNYRGKVHSNFDLVVRGFQNIYRRTFEPGTQGFSVGTPFLHKNYATGGEIQGTTVIGKSHLLTGGVETIHDRVNSTPVGIHEATRGAIYLQDEMEIAQPLTATVGARYDMHSIYEEQFNPRLAVLVRLPWDSRLRASVSRSFRAPTFDDLYWPEDAFAAGNPNLQPEKAWSYELGGEKKFGEFALFKAAGFLRDVKDLIIWQMDPDFKFRPRNVKAAEIWGAETEVVFYPARGWSIPLNYSFLYPRDESTGDPIPQKPKHIINAGVGYQTPFGLKADLRGRYVRYYVDQTTKLNRDYFVLDVRLGYEFKVYQNLKGEAFLSLNNALNEDYQTVEGYPMPPRNLNGGISLFF